MNNLMVKFESEIIQLAKSDDSRVGMLAKPVLEHFGYKVGRNAGRLLTRIPDEFKFTAHTKEMRSRGIKTAWFVTKEAIPILAIRCNLPGADQFKAWAGKVLTEVLETGQYMPADRRLRSDASTNFKVLTDALKDSYEETHEGRQTPSYIFSNDANMLNKIVFGKSARQWREENAIDAANGLNIRDKATNFELALLSLLEMKEMQLVHEHIEYQERKILLEKEAQEFKRMLPYYNKILLGAKK